MNEHGPIDPTMSPLLLSIGRAVLAAAALEKVLLVDYASRRASDEGFAATLADDLSRLERQPAGSLLRALRNIGIDDERARRISELIDRRNKLVHRFMEDSGVVQAIESGHAARLVEPVDRIARDCQRLVNELAPTAFGSLERLLGRSLEELLDIVLAIDSSSVPDARLREQVELIQTANIDELRASLSLNTRESRASDESDA